MTARQKKLGKLAQALVETAEGMAKAGLLDRPTFEKITLRHLGPEKAPRGA